MKKPTAIILAVVLFLGIGAGVFWGTSWHRAIHRTGCDTYTVLDEYEFGGDLYRVVLTDRDTSPTFYRFVRKNGIWSHSGGDNAISGVADFMSMSQGVDLLELENRYYVVGIRPTDPISFASGDLPETVAVSVDQNAKSYLLKFVWYEDPGKHSESWKVELLDLQQALYRKGLMPNPIISIE